MIGGEKVIFNAKEDVINTFKQLMKLENAGKRQQKTWLVGIDGCGGSGKSTLANELAKDFPGVTTIVRMDDFYLPTSQHINSPPKLKPVGADFDWRRLLKEVIEPIRQNKTGYYQRYDWNRDELIDPSKVSVGGIVIIEGVYSLRNELIDHYDCSIWVECPRELRLARGLDRDGVNARSMWVNNWMVSEDLYTREHKPFDKADFIINGAH